MTDKEIEKALEVCTKTYTDTTKNCGECPYKQNDVKYCKMAIHKDALGYIKRLKAENGKLQQQVVKLEEMKCMDDCTVCPYGSIISQNATDYVAIEKEQIRKDTAKEILQRVVNICKNEEDFQDGTVNKQLEPLHFGIANGCAYVRGEVEELAKEYGVEVDE